MIRGRPEPIIRSRPDTGAQHDPEAIAALNRMPDRNPWQATHDVAFPELGPAVAVMQPVPELRDEHGLATYALRMRPGTTVLTPDPSIGEGLFVVVQRGSLIHEGKEAKAMTLVYVSNEEKPYEIHAGSEGLEGLIVRFPNPVTQSAGIRANNAIITEVARGLGIRVVDIYDISLGAATDRGLVASDGLHPSGRQYALWVDRIVPSVETMVR